MTDAAYRLERLRPGLRPRHTATLSNGAQSDPLVGASGPGASAIHRGCVKTPCWPETPHRPALEIADLALCRSWRPVGTRKPSFAKGFSPDFSHSLHPSPTLRPSACWSRPRTSGMWRGVHGRHRPLAEVGWDRFEAGGYCFSWVVMVASIGAHGARLRAHRLSSIFMPSWRSNVPAFRTMCSGSSPIGL